MNGILNVLKPPGMTSFDVVAYLRGILKIKKIGHTGTLDPGAAGVLPVCTGKATKAIEYLSDKDKVYRAELLLGVSTDTQDSYGEVIREQEVKASVEDIEKVIKSFEGDYSQLPPMYSAVKMNGKKLYELARSGIEVERTPRKVKIHFINILSIRGNRVVFDVGCSKGTYIRTLCSDVGDKLGCGGHMGFLVRLKSGSFDIKNALTLEEIKETAEKGNPEEILTSIDKVFSDYDKIYLNEKDKKRFLNGGFVTLGKYGKFALTQKVRVYDKDGAFLALGEAVLNKSEELSLKIDKLFV
ncbi:MAG TPA: tRNA pseudouridine(55) synthase TruB [Hungateiclostridium thermocellum]|jgi:tRNA pseudouridine55 synthase|uniref:tRNA pseudouridine synthase B n=2 Tax=Acetivibrio thermocellus TaxID=1515 RepID=A3DE41_ACET2|nr:tRNA pseudouridine(55) synthase TruB [Acetivibrio thermocellus]CDG35681.1 tRNA pseudouridine synthase B [Acetivibrio thermocellus BC1]ABN52220.1 tRNA pseudouridine synthase B [Acetivibrio thermocellus ATCC 27405]ADU74292.1 tRNA pseudouridine synthase B [Acetivibrio thermocellus DSM 1313]ALX08234.1 tRNA pseudouridine synthase B [Acetivibrio thermocellus AD2]ANV75982.1 tRNA pseudouridine synthase B [Acetivibrio thermocellus DSM 2360]